MFIFKKYDSWSTALHFQFQDVFTEPDFGQTVIIKVSISPSARTEMRNVKSVDVEVVNIFAETTQENETTVSSKIDKEVDKSDYFSNYISQGLCDFYGCEKNAQDDCSSGRLCKCKEGWERIHPQVIFCFAPRAKCPDKCTTDHNKQCLMQNDGGAPHCACLPGYRANDDGTCQKCAFGYSGVDCKDKFELILIIVGTIAGVLILSMVIALIVSTRSNNKSKNSEEQKLIDNEFQNLRLQQTGFINQGAEGSLFPKVRTTVPRGNQPQNPYSTQLPLNQRGTPYLNY
ncbi:mucin-13 [Tamandua tetradactyla]|uniref:mucin-13 n=1 Tax=Tamandua tetradactyla TaxID=48850 RepID=UPI0040545E5E